MPTKHVPGNGSFLVFLPLTDDSVAADASLARTQEWSSKVFLLLDLACCAISMYLCLDNLDLTNKFNVWLTLLKSSCQLGTSTVSKSEVLGFWFHCR